MLQWHIRIIKLWEGSMTDAVSSLHKLPSLFRRVSNDGVLICEQLERGQADTPLADHFQQILGELDSAPFAITILGYTQEARTRVLSWLYGQAYSMLSIQVPHEAGLVELHLRERGYVLEKSDGDRVEFDRLEPFLEAVKANDLLHNGDADSWVDPLKLSLEAPSGIQGVSAFMPENSRVILENPALLGRVVANSNFTLLAAPSDYELTEEDKQATEELLEVMDGVWSVVIPASDDLTALPTSGWWRDALLMRPSLKVPPTLLSTATALPDLLLNPDDPVRQSLFSFHHAHRFNQAVETVSARHQDDMRQINSRRTREERRVKSLESQGRENDSRQKFESIKADLNDEIGRLSKGVKENSRRSLLPNAPLSEEIKKILATLRGDDLNQEEGHSAIKLSVDSQFLFHISDTSRRLLKQFHKDDMVMIRDGLSAYQEKLEFSLEEASGAPVSIDLRPVDEREIWQVIKEMLNVEIRYRGEMKKRSFMQRLGEGRKVMFMALMSLSIFGTMFGANLRGAKIMGFFLILLFIGAVIYSYFSWKKEDEALVGKELDRVRDQLGTEVKRMLSEIQRENVSKVSEQLEQIKKDALRRVDSMAKDFESSKRQQADSGRNKTREKMKLLDQRVREIQGYSQQVSRLQQGCNELERDCRAALQEVARLARQA